MTTHVPTIDMSMLRSGRRGREAAAALLDQGWTETGFAILVNHGIEDMVRTATYPVAQRLFSYPDSVLSAYETPHNGRETGFTSTGIEHAKHSKTPDLKRFWHVRCEDVPGVTPTPWPREVPEFRPTMLALFDALYRIAEELAAPINDVLGYEPGTIEGMLGKGETLLRILHYPPVLPTDVGLRSESHEDINLFTLLVAADQSGLEVKTHQGTWIPVAEEPGSIVANVGDMLQRLTRFKLISTSHRVVNPATGSNNERYSAPFFVHAKRAVIVDQETGLTAGEYLRQRLEEIGLLSSY